MVHPRPVRGHHYWEQQVSAEQHTHRRTRRPFSPPGNSPASLVEHYHPTSGAKERTHASEQDDPPD